MGNRYFSQYLLNAGILDPAKISEVLPKSTQVTPQLHLLAIQQHLLSAAQIERLAESDAAAEILENEKMLTASQLSSLRRAVPNRAVCIAQVLLDDKIADLKTIDQCFRDYDSDEIHPIKEAVKNIISKHEDMNPVEDIYGEYSEMFVGALQRFMNTDAVIVSDVSDIDVDGTHIVSQSMNGQISLAVALQAKNPVFLEMANRYSGEDLSVVDELAVDCLVEFINVLNGLYIVNLSGQDFDMDLDMPRSGQDASPVASSMVAMQVFTEFGAFVVYLAEDEFIY